MEGLLIEQKMNFVPIASRDLGPVNQKIVVNFWTSASFNGEGRG